MNDIDTLASLVFDSWMESIPELRASVQRDRHLIFEGDGVVLDLLIQEQEDCRRIRVGGQVLPEDGALSTVSNVKVHMQQGSRRTCTHTNALGEFSLNPEAASAFDLIITLKSRRFVVRGLSHADPHMWRVAPAVATGKDGR